MTALLLASLLGQAGYTPQPGETVIRLDLERGEPLFVRLYPKEAPKTVAHVLGLVRQGFYDGQSFFRVERTPRPYLAQFGDPQTKTLSLDHPNIGRGGSGRTVPFERTNRPNAVGAVGLSRPGDGSGDGDSQFYIVLGPAEFLNGKYTVFGQVVSSLDALKRLQRGDRVTSVKVVAE